jgi:hypothetical protein
MITLDSGGAARVPGTGEVQVIGTLSSDMFLADVLLRGERKVSFCDGICIVQGCEGE